VARDGPVRAADRTPMDADRAAERWRAAKRRAAERVDATVERALREAATLAWGRGFLRPPWRLAKDFDEASWRAYRYVGSAGPDDHRYLELGVVCHLDPDGNLIGFGVDNGADFMGLHDTSEYGLRRGLEYIRKQHTRVRAYASPVYDHKITGLRDEGRRQNPG
jgi:hypothetical protein